MDGDKKWTQRLVSSCMQCSLINTSFFSVYHSVIAVNIANFVVAARKESHATCGTETIGKAKPNTHILTRKGQVSKDELNPYTT